MIERTHVRVSEEVWRAVKSLQLALEAHELITSRATGGPSWGRTLYLILAHEGHLPPPADPLDQQRLETLRVILAARRTG